MKKTIVLSAIAFLFSAITFSQTKVTQDENGNYISAKKQDTEKKDKETGKTFSAPNGESYPVYESTNGKLYIIRVSKNGNEYKQYLKTEK